MAGCSKCGSNVLIHHARIIDHGAHNWEQDLSVKVYTAPFGLLFRGGVSGPLEATVCGACGFTELYVLNPRELVKAVEESEKVRREQPPREPGPWYWRCSNCHRMNAPSSKSCMDCSTSRPDSGS
ncbi:MAG TPA: hypothetical protein VKU80_03110 [Planctomycetota bacterium]|nr:hypothetical protein [Planctomycetota bacterium]